MKELWNAVMEKGKEDRRTIAGFLVENASFYREAIRGASMDLMCQLSRDIHAGYKAYDCLGMLVSEESWCASDKLVIEKLAKLYIGEK